MATFTEADILRAEKLVDFFSAQYLDETPMRIHMHGTDDGHGLGGPPFAPEFLAWIDAGSETELAKERKARRERRPYTPDHRQRVTRVFRKIRAIAPREYYVLMLVCTKGMNIPEVVRAMNDRAETGGYPERYDATGVTMLLLSSLDKASAWY